LCKLFTEELHTMPAYAQHITGDYSERIFHASPLHDIGKVGIPDSILLKPGKLTPEEFEVMKTHTTIGANTLMEVQRNFPKNEFVDMGIRIAQSHHEKWNGGGYPLGCRGTEIPLSARIMAIVDVYDAVRSKRVYKPAMSHEETCAIIYKDAGTHFDPDLVEVFRRLEGKFREVWSSLQD
jgi:putative two-component system response regulator